jgi:hypothetical protein
MHQPRIGDPVVPDEEERMQFCKLDAYHAWRIGTTPVSPPQPRRATRWFACLQLQRWPCPSRPSTTCRSPTSTSQERCKNRCSLPVAAPPTPFGMETVAYPVFAATGFSGGFIDT